MFKTKVLLDEVKGDPIRKAEVLSDIVRTISLVSDLLERAEYVRQCASLLQISEEALQNEVAKTLNRKLYENLNHKPDPNDKDLADAQTQGEQQEEQKPAEQPQSQVTPFMINPAQSQEIKIVSLLLNYGNELLSVDVTNEEGKTEKENYTVAQMIVGDLLADELTFADPVCQTIFNVYAEKIENGETMIDPQIFTMHDNEQVRKFATDNLMVDYHISDNWSEMKHIYVPMPEDRLREDVTESILTFKMKKLDIKLNELDRQFPYLTDDNEKLMLIAQKMSLWKIKQQLGQALNRVFC
jgi:DNA primase